MIWTRSWKPVVFSARNLVREVTVCFPLSKSLREGWPINFNFTGLTEVYHLCPVLWSDLWVWLFDKTFFANFIRSSGSTIQTAAKFLLRGDWSLFSADPLQFLLVVVPESFWSLGVPACPSEFLLVPWSSCWSLRVPACPLEFLLVPRSSCWSLRVPAGPSEFLLVPQSSCHAGPWEFLLVPWSPWEFLLVPIVPAGPSEFLLVPIVPACPSDFGYLLVPQGSWWPLEYPAGH